MGLYSMYFLVCGFFGLMFFVRFIVCGYRLFILIAIEYSTVGIYHDGFIHSTTGGYLGRVQFGAVVNSAAMNILEHVFW